MRSARSLGWLTVLAAGAWVSLRARADGPCERVEPGGPGDCDANGFLDDCDLGPHALGYTVRKIHNPSVDFSGNDVLLSLDFEPDGDSDILFLSEVETLSFTNRGGGVFDAPQSLPLRPGSSSTVAVDIDGDEVPDIVTADDRLGILPGKVSVFRGDGAGRFHPFRELELPEASLLTVGDLDGDGRPELVIGSNFAETLGIYSLDEGLALVLQRVIRPPRFTLEAQLADFDRDGDLDLYLRHPFAFRGGQEVNGLVSVWRNESALAFQEGPRIEDPTLTDPGRLALLDVDGDGWLDVVCGWVGGGLGGGILAAARNDRRGGYLAPVEIAKTPVAIESVTGADFNGDGDVDLLVSLGNTTYPMNGGAVLLFENLTGHEEGAVLDFVREGFSRDKITTLRDAASAADVDGKGGVEWVVYARDTGCGWPDAILVLSPLREPRSADSDGNGTPDSCDIVSGRERDTDRDGIPDRCDPEPPVERCSASGESLFDCNGNGIDDACDTTDRTLDEDRDGIPDVCQTLGGAFGITGPGLLQARLGEEAVAEYASRVFPGKELFGLEPGIQGWSVSIRAYDCKVMWATTSGTDGAEFCEGGPRRYGYEATEVTTKEGFSGAASAVLLSFLEPVTLPVDRPGLLLRLGVRAIGPEVPGTATVKLVHEDGLRINGFPIQNVITRLGATVYPELLGRSITVTSVPDPFRRRRQHRWARRYLGRDPHAVEPIPGRAALDVPRRGGLRRLGSRGYQRCDRDVPDALPRRAPPAGSREARVRHRSDARLDHVS